MKALFKILILAILISVSGCSTKRRTIKLNPIGDDSLKIGIDTGTALILFSRNDLIDLLNKDLEEWFDPRIKQYVDNLSSVKTDTIFVKNKNIASLPLAEYELKFHSLMLDGKAKVKLNGENQMLEKIKYEFTKSKLGQEDAYFFTKDGYQFYHILLAFGE